MAGIAGVDPRPLTLRQLVWMSDGRRHHDWGLVSSQIAALYEVHRDRKRRRRPFSASEFNPLLRTRAAVIPVSVGQLVGMLGVGKLKEDVPNHGHNHLSN